jgi:ADP-ribose pyrophosphatase YjhB (NUDIX family)
MLSFKHSKGRFSCRAVGVVIDRERLLIHRAEGDDFWALPGGRVEFGEPASVALARELAEELDIAVEVGRLIWIAENFFTYQGMQHHEIGFYFQVTLLDGSPLQALSEPFVRYDESVPLTFEWHPIAGLEGVALYPTFLREAIADMPAYTQYIVHRDEAHTDDVADQQVIR